MVHPQHNDDSDDRRRRQRRRDTATTGDSNGGGCPRKLYSTACFDRVMGDTAYGAIEIERGGDENITINHGCRQGEGGRQAARRL